MNNPDTIQTGALPLAEKPFAEVIESSIDHLIAQCWDEKQAPLFGSFVQINHKSSRVIGIVTQVKTGSMDPMRYPFPYKKTETELRAEQPQIFEFLKTTFDIVLVGYQEYKENRKTLGPILYLTHPKPCSIHSFITLCPAAFIKTFFNKIDFLDLLFSFAHTITNLDELLLVILKRASDQKILTAEILQQFCHRFSLLTGSDYRRLKLFLSRIEHNLTIQTQ